MWLCTCICAISILHHLFKPKNLCGLSVTWLGACVGISFPFYFSCVLRNCFNNSHTDLDSGGKKSCRNDRTLIRIVQEQSVHCNPKMLSALLFCCTLTATFLLSCRWRCTVKCWISFTHWPDILLRSVRHLCSASQLLTLVFPAQSFFLNRDHWWLLALKCASVLFTFTSYTLVPTLHLPCTHTDLNKQPSVCLSVSAPVSLFHTLLKSVPAELGELHNFKILS